MKLAKALSIADRAIAAADKAGVTIAVAVLDEFGQLVQLDRMDGASLMTTDLAEAKAATSLNFKKPTSEVAKLPSETLASIGRAAFFKLVLLPGGFPIFEDGRLVGAVGVSGDDTAQDDAIAREAASA